VAEPVPCARATGAADAADPAYPATASDIAAATAAASTAIGPRFIAGTDLKVWRFIM
jgi:hypothetical protein